MTVTPVEVQTATVQEWSDLTERSSFRPQLSIVIPLFNEADSLPELYDELCSSLEQLGRRFEIIFVDDGSTDGSASLLRKLHQNDSRVQVIQFRRNFGKSAALRAGFDSALGEVIVTMDGDLQDVPAEIPGMLAELEDDTDLVSGWKHPRNDPISKRLPSAIFNFVVRTFTGVEIHDFNCGFKAYRAEVTREIPLYGELHRYIPVLAHHRGFRVRELRVRHRPRRHGQSKFGSTRFARGFFDLLTVLFLTQYTVRPLHFFGWFGIATLGMGFLINAYLAILWFMGQPIGTRPLLTLGVLLMIIGGQFFVFGLLAEMIASVSSRGSDYSIRRHLRHEPRERTVTSDDDVS